MKAYRNVAIFVTAAVITALLQCYQASLKPQLTTSCLRGNIAYYLFRSNTNSLCSSLFNCLEGCSGKTQTYSLLFL